MMTCSNCWEKGHNKKTCKKDPQPKPTKEKRKPGRKKADSAFVFPNDGHQSYGVAAIDGVSVEGPSGVAASDGGGQSGVGDTSFLQLLV